MKTVSYSEYVASIDEALEFIDEISEKEEDLFIGRITIYPSVDEFAVDVSLTDVDPLEPKVGEIVAVGNLGVLNG